MVFALSLGIWFLFSGYRVGWRLGLVHREIGGGMDGNASYECVFVVRYVGGIWCVDK